MAKPEDEPTNAASECPICIAYSGMLGETCGFHGSVPVEQTSATPVPDRCVHHPFQYATP